MWYSSELLLEGEDALTLCEGEKVTLINWGNVVIRRINKYVIDGGRSLLGTSE